MTATTMTQTSRSVEDLILEIRKEIFVKAPISTTFEALIEQVGPGNERPDGEPMPMTLEAWPGGRWFRDLGDKNGHFWGHVQAIKRPTLLEISGPLFASYPFASNVQYRLSESNGGTLITFHHVGLGLVEDAHRKGVQTGWSYILEGVRKRAEGTK